MFLAGLAEPEFAGILLTFAFLWNGFARQAQASMNRVQELSTPEPASPLMDEGGNVGFFQVDNYSDEIPPAFHSQQGLRSRGIR